MRSSFLLITGPTTLVISGEGLTVEVVGADKPETATKQRANVLSQHEVRPGSTSLGTEQQCDTLGVTAGETATNSHSALNSSRVAEQTGEVGPDASPVTNSPSRAARGPRENAMNESATDMRASAHCQPAGSNSRITSPAKIQAKTLEQSIRLLRPGYRHPDNTALCGGNGRRLCRDCAIQSEAAA